MCDGALGPHNIDCVSQVSWSGWVVTLCWVGGVLAVEIVDCDGAAHSVLLAELLHTRDFPGWLRRPADIGQMVLLPTLTARFSKCSATFLSVLQTVRRRVPRSATEITRFLDVLVRR